jgi:hypothetical protein
VDQESVQLHKKGVVDCIKVDQESVQLHKGAVDCIKMDQESVQLHKKGAVDCIKLHQESVQLRGSVKAVISLWVLKFSVQLSNYRIFRKTVQITDCVFIAVLADVFHFE